MAKCGFLSSKRDALFSIACIVFVVANLGAIGSTGRRRTKEMVCLSNLRQWGAIFQKYTNDNNGYFPEVSSPGWPRGTWILAFQHLLETRKNLFRCPEATNRLPSGANYGGPFNTYIIGTISGIPVEASYGANCWIYKSPPGEDDIQSRPTKWNWQTPYVKNAKTIPVFADTMWRGGGPFSGEPGAGRYPERGHPPDYDGQWDGFSSEIKHFCINRHNGAVNHLFMDWSVRKVGLKELWTLKWHREFNTAGPWTKAGGCQPYHWPEWMRNFKDY